MQSAGERVLGLALVAVLVMSIVGLAASQTFINKTGKTVIGIKIEFSKRVMITRHDSAFPDQSPGGRSQEFTFSGKDLRNFGRFTVSWMPSSGKVVDYGWIEKAQHAQTTHVTSPSSEQEFALPDPNTPPILYGDDYPGLDEALYQPQPDEQIWLTDLDGHEDIYDNDSIKINYAPGFDVSKITSIDVYRNGIRLLFVPEKFDVLTNAQMKTFDGNPAEHSPASNHTDHAIMGYEYKFEIRTADHVWTFTKTVKSGFRWRPKYMYSYLASAQTWLLGLRSLSDADILAYLETLKSKGFNGVSIDLPIFMNSPYDNSLFCQYTPDESVHEWLITSPTDEELEHLLSLVNEAGLESEARAQIYVAAKFRQEHPNRYGATITPTNVSLWFNNYTVMAAHLASTIKKYKVTRYTPFTEMDSLERYSNQLKNFYGSVSSEFSGDLGFEESTNHYLEGFGFTDRWVDAPFEQLVGKFWDFTSQAGAPLMVEWSCWTPKLDDQNDQRLSVMVKSFDQFWSPAYTYYRSKYPGHEIVYGEIGTYPVDGVCRGSDYFYSHIEHQQWDVQEFNDIFAAYLIGAKTLGVDGMSLWYTPLGEVDDLRLVNGVISLDSSTMKVIQAIIKPEGE